MTSKIPASPTGCGPDGRRLWRAVLTDYELSEHESVLLARACRVADTCADLQRRVDDEGAIVHALHGDRVNPALIELRAQGILLARLIVALRVPLGSQETDAPAAPARLQSRPLRGVYGLVQ